VLEIGNSVIIPHIFGTIALITMFFSVGSYYNGLHVDMNREASKTQLGQVADYISSNIIDLVVLSQLTKEEVFLVKKIKLPLYVGEHYYNISLIEMPSTYTGEELFKVYTEIETEYIYSTSELPWAKSPALQIFSNQSISTRYDNDIELHTHVMSNGADRRAAETGDICSLVIWCCKSENSTIVGLGVLSIK
jgi:hypothetical protein